MSAKKILDGAGVPPDKPTTSTMLVGIAQERYTLHRDDHDDPFALPADGPAIARYLRGSRSLRGELARVYYQREGKVPSSSALADALATIEGLCMASAPQETSLRVARASSASVYLDLGHDDGAAVHITPGRWAVAENPPVIWRRTRKTRDLPLPEPGGSLADLWRLARVPDDEQSLAAAWIACALLGLVTPILDITGEHGSGKTSTAMAIAGTIDTARPGSVPGSPVDLFVASAARYVTILDNLSAIPGWLQDALCRMITGDELDRRMLYTDSDVAVLQLQRPAITTSIDVGAVQADYGDRRVTLHIPVLSEKDGWDEGSWRDDWAKHRSAIAGAVLDLAAGILAVLPGILLDRMPRMGDYARVLAATDKVLGTDGSRQYRAQRRSAQAAAIEDDVIGPPLLAYLDDYSGDWAGDISTLMAVTEPDAGPPKGWPASPRAYTAHLARITKPLRSAGYIVERTDRQDPRTRRAIWQIERVPITSFASFDPSQTYSDQRKPTEGSREGPRRAGIDPSRRNPRSEPQEKGPKDAKDLSGTSLPSVTGSRIAFPGNSSRPGIPVTASDRIGCPCALCGKPATRRAAGLPSCNGCAGDLMADSRKLQK